jgi:hypothetical protein
MLTLIKAEVACSFTKHKKYVTCLKINYTKCKNMHCSGDLETRQLVFNSIIVLPSEKVDLLVTEPSMLPMCIKIKQQIHKANTADSKLDTNGKPQLARNVYVHVYVCVYIYIYIYI